MSLDIFAVGDQAVVKIAGKADGVAVDTVGMIVGYMQQCYSRVNFKRNVAGIYNILNWVLFRTENGQTYNLTASQLQLVTRGPNPLPKPSALSPLGYPLQFVGPLPELALWEGDFATLNLNGKTDRVEIIDINYTVVCNDSDPTPPEERRGYHIMFTDGKRRACVAANCLTLESRGKIWQLYHGEQPQFSSPTEEQTFREIVAPPPSANA